MKMNKILSANEFYGRKPSVVITGFMLSVLLSACGGGSSSSDTTTTTATGTSTSSSPSSASDSTTSTSTTKGDTATTGNTATNTTGNAAGTTTSTGTAAGNTTGTTASTATGSTTSSTSASTSTTSGSSTTSATTSSTATGNATNSTSDTANNSSSTSTSTTPTSSTSSTSTTPTSSTSSTSTTPTSSTNTSGSTSSSTTPASSTSNNTTSTTTETTASGTTSTAPTGSSTSGSTTSTSNTSSTSTPTNGDVGATNDGQRYVKVDNQGNELPADASNWRCVKDRTTGLLWEEKTNDNGLQDKDWRYRHFHNYAGYASYIDYNGKILCENIGGSSCDAYSYVNALNAQGLCGRNNWRLPVMEELLNLAQWNAGGVRPSIDLNYFPETTNNSGYGSYCSENMKVDEYGNRVEENYQGVDYSMPIYGDNLKGSLMMALRFSGEVQDGLTVYPSANWICYTRLVSSK